MLSEVIPSRRSYPAFLLVKEQVDQRSVHSGPLVLGANPLNNQRLQEIGDQPVSRTFPDIPIGVGLYLILFREH
jgi:hypothetical protein